MACRAVVAGPSSSPPATVGGGGSGTPGPAPPARGKAAQAPRSVVGRVTFVQGDKAVGAALPVQLLPPLCT